MTSRLQWLFTRDEMPRGLWAIEWLALAYSALTTVIMLFLWDRMQHPAEMLTHRIAIAVGTLLVWQIYRLLPVRIMTFVRITVQMSLLGFWYPDTYEFNSVLPNLDHVFAGLDHAHFGCQPALVFSRMCPWPWFSEAVNMGYFSYYPMIIAVMVWFFLQRNDRYERASFIVMCSFLIYYLIYISLPVAGPQFYFCAVDLSQIEAGVFPDVGTWFSTHTDILPAPGYPDGLFYRLVNFAQESGERPTAAFPSSHIGITLILLYLVYPQSKRFFFCLLPFALLLGMATVYIQAHYLVDAIAGVVSSVLVFMLSKTVCRLCLPSASVNTRTNCRPETRAGAK